MLKSGTKIRFTSTEVAELSELGIDVTGVKNADAFANALYPWVEALGEVRPDLLDKLARDLAQAKGIELPPALIPLPCPDSPERS